MRAKSAVLNSISTVLETGHRAIVNAVTWRIGPDCFNLLCASNEETVASDQAQTMIHKVPIDPVKGRKLLSSWEDTPDLPQEETFSTHASQLGSILAYIFGQNRSQEADTVIYRDLALFIERRARFNIVGRITYVKTIWEDCPSKTMRTWYETHTVLSSTVEFPYLVPALIKLLAEHNLHPEPVQLKRYTLTSSNALDWLDVLEKTLSDITQAYGNTQVAPSSEQTLRANEAIENLYTLLRSNLSGALIQHDVHTALARTYRGCGELEQRKLDSIGESGMKGSGLQIPAVSVQDDPDVDEHGK
ncbi:hypothetical protein PYCCODRAFT_1471749 [Trametes coccinea BRFM310]|uniref:Uncharacterized protein n=1 Tax=Trametes coccinea (strain BRFM310) TaxID=1353009 RepID=A0A1Y2I8X4_TRAC3|nr:hypothetical protein PYCCODRAFT_1471749 [Trametes coccinea BRFM310]